MNIKVSIILIVLTVLLTKAFCALAQNTKLMDEPNERSLHVTPTVRGGGVVFIGFFLLSIPFSGYYYNISLVNQLILFFSTASIALISFLDDLYSLSAPLRFGVQCVAAALISFYAFPPALNFILFKLTNPYLIAGFIFFTTLWAINHFNFMDGLDGFCGSQSLFLFFSYALLFGLHQALFYQDLCWILVFGLVGFLTFNLPPAKLFMGDVGSATLGFISFVLALIAQQKFDIPILYWFILNSLFLFDATFTLVRRIYKKEQWFIAHCKHAYQRLKRYGMNTRFILLGQLFINSFLFIVVLLMEQQFVSPYILFLGCFVLLIIIYSLIERVHPMFSKSLDVVK